MEVLSQFPTPEQIETCIVQSGTSTTQTLQLVAALLKHTVPQTYPQLPAQTQNAIIHKFRSAIGLGNLLSRIKLLLESKAAKEDVAKSLRAHALLLGSVLTPGLVPEMSQNSSAREIDKLLYKGLSYSIFKEAVMRFDIEAPPALASLESYTLFLAQELTYVDSVNPCLASLLSLGAPTSFFSFFFRRDRISALSRFAKDCKRFEKKSLFAKYLDFLLVRYLRKDASHENISALSVITSATHLPVVDEMVLENVISSFSYQLNVLVSLLAPKEHIQKLLASWGNKNIVANETITKQGYRTHLLVCLCQQLTATEAQDLMKSTDFVEGVSNRLLSLSHQVKALGVYFSDQLSDIAQKPRIFEASVADDIASAFPMVYIKKANLAMTLEDAWDVLESPSVIPAEEEDLSIAPLTIHSVPEEPSDASDEEDDPTIGNKKKVAKPLYIRDLLAYLSVDVKEPDAYEKRKIAMREAPTLLRQKSSFGTEVSFYAEDIFTQLVAMSNYFETPDFETFRLNAMIAVVVSHPPVTHHICSLLLTGDYSLQQRLCLLSSMSFGARALRGQKDDIVESSYKPSVFPTSMLPAHLHTQYNLMDYGYSAVENKLQNELMQDASEKARDSLAGGRVLRMSAKLTRKAAASDESADFSVELTKIVGRRFFFPLVAVWHQSGGIDIGHYSAILIAHFIRTLSLVLHCAYPNAMDMNEMAGEFLGLVTPVLQATTVDQLQVLESIITGVLLVCEIVDHTYVVTRFDRDLYIIENLLSECWEQIIDERVKSLCAGLLLKLSEIKEDLQKTLMGQMNSGLI